jgi:hypothetical protein
MGGHTILSGLLEQLKNGKEVMIFRTDSKSSREQQTHLFQQPISALIDRKAFDVKIQGEQP